MKVIENIKSIHTLISGSFYWKELKILALFSLLQCV